MITKIMPLVFFIVQIAFAQQDQLSKYPYGGLPNPNRKNNDDRQSPLDFHNPMSYTGAVFKDPAEFAKAHFFNKVQFSDASFNAKADFRRAHFLKKVEFIHTRFDSLVEFDKAEFLNVNFEETIFRNRVNFNEVIFKDFANFRKVKFYHEVDFTGVILPKVVNFRNAHFYKSVDFRGINFYNCDSVDFSFAVPYDSIFIGDSKSGPLQKFDFSKTICVEEGELNFPKIRQSDLPEKKIKYPGTTIVLTAPVDLKIQLEKFKYISLPEKLDYFTKKEIIETLKDISYKADKFHRERFELDYIFAKSTMYQIESSIYIEKSLFYRTISYIYYCIMGLGYEPFRIMLLMLFIIIVFDIFYSLSRSYKDSINKYIKDILNSKDDPFEFTKWEELLNCLYFSVMIFFNIRLKSEVLTSFSMKQKIWIVIEWGSSFGCYFVFVLCSKAGSIWFTLINNLMGN